MSAKARRTAVNDLSHMEELTFTSDPRKFRGVRHWLAGLARKHGFGERDVRELTVAVNEACANIHKHAYHGRTDGRIDLEVEIEHSIMRLSVQDYGTKFDIAGYRPPDLSAPAEHGYGLLLMTKLMDHVQWFQMEEGTRVVMVKGSAPREPRNTEQRRL
jgi:serine/threonine-protein kinase RsbW